MTEPSSNNSRRFASVAGKLAPKSPSPGLHAVPSAETPTPERETPPVATDQGAEPTKKPRQPKKPEAPRAAGATRPVVFLAPVEIREALRARSQAEKRSQPNVVLDAIEASRGRLSTLLNDAGPERTELFVRPARTRQPTTTVPISVRLPSQAVETIDALVVKEKAPSRTDLLVAALRGYLTVEDT